MIPIKRHNKKDTKAFTLIELLVVIAIIGILSSVVLASLSTARAKGRDARRVSDIKQIQLALELYADQNLGKYPPALCSGAGATCIAPIYIATLPTDPSGGTTYTYAALGTGTSCTGYHLGAVLEQNNSVLTGDADAAASTVVCAAGDFAGISVACTGTAAALTDDRCFDVVNQ